MRKSPPNTPKKIQKTVEVKAGRRAPTLNTKTTKDSCSVSAESVPGGRPVSHVPANHPPIAKKENHTSTNSVKRSTHGKRTGGLLGPFVPTKMNGEKNEEQPDIKSNVDGALVYSVSAFQSHSGDVRRDEIGSGKK